MLWTLLLAFVAWVAASMKTSRADGELISNLHPYRRLMAYIMRDKSEAVVYFDTYVDARPLLAFVEKSKAHRDIDITHCLVGAAMVGLHRVPSMNRFVVGRRLYQRKYAEVSFSMKRKQKDRAAKLANVKLRLQAGETFAQLCERIEASISSNRGDERTREDQEFSLLNALPRPLLRGAVALAQTLDYFNMAPTALIGPDPLYTSLYCANLGSLGMDPGYHHLYEWGTCPLFMMVGKVEDKPRVVDGKIEIVPTLHVRWTYDERIDDGLNASHGIGAVQEAIEAPERYLGCLSANGDDQYALDGHPLRA